jgi:hypothetical protein
LARPRLAPRLWLARRLWLAWRLWCRPMVLLSSLCLLTRRGVHQRPATPARRCGSHLEQHRRAGTAFGRSSFTPRCKPLRRNHPRFIRRGRGTSKGRGRCWLSNAARVAFESRRLAEKAPQDEHAFQAERDKLCREQPWDQPCAPNPPWSASWRFLHCGGDPGGLGAVTRERGK